MSDWLKIRLAVGGLILFIVSIFFSASELWYLAFGKTTQATIVAVQEVTKRGRFGSTRTQLRVRYNFDEGDGIRKTEMDTVGTDWIDKLEGGTVAVQYLPGSPESSRLSGNNHMFFVWVLPACLVALGVVTWRFWIDYQKVAKWRPGGSSGR